jgi:hypothetical protein
MKGGRPDCVNSHGRPNPSHGGSFNGQSYPIIPQSVQDSHRIAGFFLALGLLLLIALNELSKLGLDVTAPKVQG